MIQRKADTKPIKIDNRKANNYKALRGTSQIIQNNLIYNLAQMKYISVRQMVIGEIRNFKKIPKNTYLT